MDFLSDSPVLLSAVVFAARVVDVSLGTVRTILVIRAFRVRAALIGFVEILIWLMAASAVLRDLSQWYIAVAYAGGFAAGNYVGIWLETKLAMGMELVRMISSNHDVDLAAMLRDEGFSITELNGHDDDGKPVEVLLVVEERRRLPRLLRLIEGADPDAIYTISDVKRHRGGARIGARTSRMLVKRK
ncbi:MAG: DUF2179 domain-containing protein [Planctomycetota bacterium]